MTDQGICPPVLILGFNRPDTTSRVLEALRPVRPAQLYFAVDGPRAERAGERERVLEVQRLAERIDWPCEAYTLFRDSNLGCKLAVSEAISWFFDRVEAGIILEDDCVAHPNFFRFAAELLDRFHDDERVLMISGDNFQFGRRRTPYSYYFSLYTHIWGWATWRRAWRLYDHRMSLWPELRDGGWLEDVLGDRVAAASWSRIFEDTWRERNSSWAYRWTFAAWVQGALTVLPAVNLVSNIGFGEQATHTRRANPLAALPAQPMDFPLSHPPYVIRDARADRYTQRAVFSSGSLLRRAARALYRGMRPA
ncbi:MAG TPA: glycosyltransferase family 2 protein [Burkholderiales bacterium]|nr:glycosyltransferase family 2 protein [Burkholderiales bacterium]